MRALLNIGLESSTLGKITPAEVVAAARLHWLTVTAAKRVQSDTEPTMVLEVIMRGHDSVENTRTLRRLAEDLGQDCIAVYCRLPIANFGALVGPRAAEWGPFNPEFFFLLDGTRLQPPVSKAA